MALRIDIEHESGGSVSYWNIGAIQEDFKGKGTEITVYGYPTETARRQEKQPLSAKKFNFAGDEYVAGADRSVYYAKLKQMPDFEGAVDA